MNYKELSKVSDITDREKQVLAQVREHADEILKGAGIKFSKVVNVTPHGDTFAVRYINSSGVPMITYFAKTGQSKTVGIYTPRSSNIIKEINSRY